MCFKWEKMVNIGYWDKQGLNMVNGIFNGIPLANQTC